MKQLRLYIDTSVFGGYYEAKFAEDSKRLIESAKSGRNIFLVSEVVVTELRGAPQNVG